METQYQPKILEKALQDHWEQQNTFRAQEDLNKEKFYSLVMFPYPSGRIHMGHVRNYTIGDVVARYQHMLGKNVLQPIGWDAFGLPAENAAIKNKTAPSTWTYENIEQMRQQLKQLGFAYDWSREIATCKPEYYHWEQWFFVKLYEKGLVYKRNAVVNWDPVDQTVLANEQVVNGCGWRSGAKIERREIPQWFIKITAYAEELLQDIDTLEKWPDSVKTMQRNWIGRSEGSQIQFKIADANDVISVYTTRPDTLYGATYLAIAPDHPLTKRLANEHNDIRKFISEWQAVKVAEADMAQLDKVGIKTGLMAIHPLTGNLIPVWIANFVLMDYGSGAVMSVPAHDQRDYEFAQKYDLPIEQVIEPYETIHNFNQSAYTEGGRLINSNEFNGLDWLEAKIQITEALIEKGLGQHTISYRLRDWGVSRQRYWGTPIPIIYCDQCGTVPVPEKDLPVLLPENIQIPETGSALKHDENFLYTQCPKCQAKATRETDTFDTFMESSWYYARYCSWNQESTMLDERAKYWTPVDFYVGGVEHAVMHLLYARFFHKLMRDIGLINSDEPFTELLTQGMVLKDGSKMSKSKGNTVDPQTLIDAYGADTVRLFSIFAAPPEQSLEWSDAGVEGAFRFLKRLWAYASDHHSLIKDINETQANQNIVWTDCSDSIRELRKESQETLKQILFDYERKQFNTVVSGCMKLFNIISQIPMDNSINHEALLCHENLAILLRVLAPITPHMTERLWQELRYGKSLQQGPWPKISKEALKLDLVEFVVQVNGKLRGKIKAPPQLDADALVQLAMQEEGVKKNVENKKVIKSIVVNNRQLINLVVQ